MPTFELEESEYVGPIPEDMEFEADVLSVKLVEEKYNDEKTGKPVKKVEFVFVLDELDSPYDGKEIKGKTTTRFNDHPDCRLRHWAEAILATELPAKYVLDTDILIGNKCRVRIGAREWETQEGEKRVYNFAKDVLRSQTMAAAADEAF